MWRDDYYFSRSGILKTELQRDGLWNQVTFGDPKSVLTWAGFFMPRDTQTSSLFSLLHQSPTGIETFNSRVSRTLHLGFNQLLQEKTKLKYCTSLVIQHPRLDFSLFYGCLSRSVKCSNAYLLSHQRPEPRKSPETKLFKRPVFILTLFFSTS